MAGISNFRTAFNGFHRKDVVDYIEYMNNKHNAEKEQLNNRHIAELEQLNAQHAAQLEKLNAQLEAASNAPSEDGLQEKLEAAELRILELEEELAKQTPAAPAEVKSCTEEELEAYRRAERAERQANERAKQIYDQANAVLAEATLKAEDAAVHIGTIADQVSEQLKDYQQSIQGTKEAFQEAVATLCAIRPDNVE